MNKRFEIPLQPGEHNLFAIDDYLRSIRTAEQRKTLISTVGYSTELRQAYETRHALPHGAVELAMMAEDKRVKELNDALAKRLSAAQADSFTPTQLKEFYLEVESKAAGLKTLYPEAMQFLLEYSALAQRNTASFRGDYRFSNEYKIILAQCNPNPNQNFNSNVNWTITVNAAILINAAIFINVAVGFKYVLALVLWIWAAAFVIP